MNACSSQKSVLAFNVEKAGADASLPFIAKFVVAVLTGFIADYSRKRQVRSRNGGWIEALCGFVVIVCAWIVAVAVHSSRAKAVIMLRVHLLRYISSFGWLPVQLQPSRLWRRVQCQYDYCIGWCTWHRAEWPHGEPPRSVAKVVHACVFQCTSLGGVTWYHGVAGTAAR